MDHRFRRIMPQHKNVSSRTHSIVRVMDYVYRFFEGLLLWLILFVIIYSDSHDIIKTSLIMVQTLVLIGYVEYIFKSIWPRIVLPVSMASVTYLAAKMIEYTVIQSIYPWIILIYGVAVFILYHAMSRLINVFMWERKGRFKTIYEDIRIDMILFLVAASIDTYILLINHAIKMWAAIILLIIMYSLWFTSPYIIRDYVLAKLLLLTGRRIKGYVHPQEPEIEKVHLAIASITVLASMSIPFLYAYASPILLRRAFVPLALLAVYEVIVIALFVTTYIFILHGGFIEALAGGRYVRVEDYNVFDAWRDIAWYMNRSAGYFIRMKYLAALYMLFQGLEILSIRIGDKNLYFGPIYDVLEEGYRGLKENKLVSEYVFWRAIDETMNIFKPDKVYIVEPNWKPIEGTGFEEQFRRAAGTIVNLYCKLHEVPREARREAAEMLMNAKSKLETLYFKARRIVKPYIREYISRIDDLLLKAREGKITIDDIEEMELIIKTPLTINMLRNYLVHGQLFKNALVYKGNRVKIDRIMAKPSTLYSIYVLILVSAIRRAPMLLEEKGRDMG